MFERLTPSFSTSKSFLGVELDTPEALTGTSDFTLSRCESLLLYQIMHGNRVMEVQRRKKNVVGSDNIEIVWEF